MGAAVRHLNPVRDRAMHIITEALGFQPPLHRPMSIHGETPMVIALIELEKAFSIDIDADEAVFCKDIAELLDLVEFRALAAALPSREPDWEIDPAVMASSFPGTPRHDPPPAPQCIWRAVEVIHESAPCQAFTPRTPPAPPKRKHTRPADIAAGLLIVLALALAASGRLDLEHPFAATAPIVFTAR